MHSKKSLHAQGHILADTSYQLKVLETHEITTSDFPKFEDKLTNAGLFPFKPTGIEIFQVNVGYMCNQTCAHCHVDAGPDRKEIMTRETMKQCLKALAQVFYVLNFIVVFILHFCSVVPACTYWWIYNF